MKMPVNTIGRLAVATILAASSLILNARPVIAAEVSIVDNTVITTQLGSPWVTLRAKDGAGISYICAAGFAAGADWTECYKEFVPINQAAGNRMYMGSDGYLRLYETQSYIGPRPIFVNTPANEATVIRLGDLLKRATPAELKQLREAVDATGGNLSQLASRLDAFEARLDAVEEVNNKQTARLDDIDSFVNPLQAELGGRTLTEFVGEQANPGIPWWTWVPALILSLLLFLAIYSLFKLVVWVIARPEPKQLDLEQFATKAELTSLEGKVEDETAKWVDVDQQVAEFGEQLSDVEVVAGAALTLASPLKFTETTDLSSLNHGATSTWTARDTKTRKHYEIPFTKNEDGMIEAPIFRRAGHPHYIQPFRFRSIEGTVNMLCLAHADDRLEGCLKHKPKT